MNTRHDVEESLVHLAEARSKLLAGWRSGARPESILDALCEIGLAELHLSSLFAAANQVSE